MTAEHPNATAYRRTADAFRAGDLARLEELVDAEVTWHVPGTHPMAGDVHGRRNLLEWLGELSRKGFWLTEQDVFANDEHVCAISVMGTNRPGYEVHTRVVSVFRYQNGRQLERWLYPDDSDAWHQIFAD